MVHFVFSDNDSRFCFLKYDTEEEYKILHTEMLGYFNLIDPVCYLANYTGIPFTQDFIYEYRQNNGTIIFYFSIGLTITVWRWLKSKGIDSDGLDESRFKRKLPHTFEEFKSIVDSWQLNIDPRPYQYEAAYKILEWKRSVSELATRAGKTLIAYMIFRYSMEYLGSKRILMIVPSIDLVKQGFSDFKDYKEFFNTECLWSGGKVVESSNLTIATFQTLINYLNKKSKKYNPKFFDGYDLVFVDETHRANASSIKNIISADFMKNVKLAYGMTGTIPKEGTIDSFALHSLLGAKIQEIKPKELMDAGYISQLKIYQHRIRYKDKVKQLETWCRCAEYCLSTFVEVPNKKNPRKKDRVPLKNPEFLIAYEKDYPAGLVMAKNKIMSNKDKSYLENLLDYKKLLENYIKGSTSANVLHVEIMTVHFFEQRIDYLIELLKTRNKNTLILAQHVEYIKHIADRLKDAFPDRPIVCVYGASKERKGAKDILANNDNAIMVAGYSIMSTGITLKNLCYGFLFESFKSNIVNMQSIGRGLGKSDNKEYYELHDITDCFDKDVASNKIYLQGLERIKLYKDNHYSFNIIDKEL